MKIINIYLGIGILVIFLIYGIYNLASFSIFDDEILLLEQIDIPGKEYDLRIYHIPSNASSQSYLQVREINNGVESVLESYKNYNFIDSYKLLLPDTFNLIISDTSKVNSRKEVKILLP